MSFDLTQKIKIVNPTANIDELYGTYDSILLALAGVPLVLRELGRTVGVVENGSVVEYWWKDGTADGDLVAKNEGGSGTLVDITAGTNITIDKSNPSNPVISATGGGGSGAVDSVFGRTGIVTAETGDYTVAQVTDAQETLVSGTNIKTINGESLLGSTDIEVQAPLEVYSESGTLAGGDAAATIGDVDFMTQSGSGLKYLKNFMGSGQSVLYLNADNATIKSKNFTLSEVSVGLKSGAEIRSEDNVVFLGKHEEFSPPLLALDYSQILDEGVIKTQSFQNKSGVIPVLPTSKGTSGQFLQTDGDDNVVWATPSGGGGLLLPERTGRANKVLLSYDEGMYWSNNFNLKNSLKIAYVADASGDNLNKLNPTVIRTVDTVNKTIKVNLDSLAFLLQKGTSGEPWVISLGGENETYAEVVSVAQDTGLITYVTKKGSFDTQATIGTKVEFFNPFVNYELVSRDPLLLPANLSGVTTKTYTFLVVTGLVEKVGHWDMIVKAYGTTDGYYIARSTDLKNWAFVGSEIFTADGTNGMQMVMSPYKMDDGNLLVFAAFKKSNPVWRGVYGITDANYNLTTAFTYMSFFRPADITAAHENTAELLDLIYFEGHYRGMVHYRKDDNDPTEVTKELIVKCPKSDVNVIKFLTKGFAQSEYTWIDVQDSTMFNIFATKKNDGVTYVENNGQLSIFSSSEQLSNGQGITSNNRLIGVAHLEKGLTLDSQRWVYQKDSPSIINPVQLHISYPDLFWAWDHVGAPMVHTIVNNTMYLFTTFGGDQVPYEYVPTGLKIELSK